MHVKSDPSEPRNVIIIKCTGENNGDDESLPSEMNRSSRRRFVVTYIQNETILQRQPFSPVIPGRGNTLQGAIEKYPCEHNNKVAGYEIGEFGLQIAALIAQFAGADFA